MRLTVVYDNSSLVEGLKAAWGFSCLVELDGTTVLFDTGGDFGTLLHNMMHLRIDPRSMDAVVLSHAHSDHVGGLSGILGLNPGLEVFLPASFSQSIKDAVRSAAGVPIEVSGARQIREGIRSTGEAGSYIREQALLVLCGRGSVLITGCAHPGIVEMVESAARSTGGHISLVMGGFHLGGKRSSEVEIIAARLKAVGVSRVGPCHCTGNKAIEAFRNSYGDAFFQIGVGRRIIASNLESADEER